MSVPRKKLIEVSIPLEAINAASAREKSIRHGHPSTLHLWWARRPLAACRAVLFAQLVDDPSSWPEHFPTEEAQDAERRRLHKIIEEMVPWEASNNELVLNKARWEIARSVARGCGEEPPLKNDPKAILDYLQTKAPPVYDPFSGGGSIPLEAQRLGLRAYGSDLNPVAVLIGKALVEIPPKFAGKPPVNPNAREEAKHGALRGWRGAQGLADDVRHYGKWMREEAGKRIGHLYPKAKLPDGSEATVIAWLWARTVRSPDPAARGAMVPLVSSFMLSTKKGKKAWVEPVIDPEAQDGWRFEVKTGKVSTDREAELKEGTIGRGKGGTCVLTGASMPFSYVREQGQVNGLGFRLMAMVAEADRERIYLNPDERHEQTALRARPLWEPEGDLPANPRNFNTPIYGLTSFASLFTKRQLVALTTFSDLIPEAHTAAKDQAKDAGFPNGAELHNGGNGALAYADAVATYLAFWLKKPLHSIWPELFRRLATPKDEELVATPYRHGTKDKAEQFFMSGMSEALIAMRNASADDEPLAIFYAFKQSEVAHDGITSAGWASFLQAIVDAGLVVDGTWPIRTEAVNALKANMNALASSIVLICWRSSSNQTTTRADFIRTLKREMPKAIQDIRKAGVGPVDMQQSVIGPAMGIFSRFTKVLEDDDSAMIVRTALSIINRVWEEIENELDAAFDAETQVALAWYSTYGFDARSSGELITLANAKNIPSTALFSSGVFKDMKGKAGLIPRDELPSHWLPRTDKTLTVWECVQHTARVLNAAHGGGEAAARLVAQMGSKGADARALAYRLFEIATKKGYSNEALIYNELAQEWPKLEDLTSLASAMSTTAQGQLALG